MEDKNLIFFGTFGLLTFNMLIGIFGWMAFSSLKFYWATLLMTPFVASAIYFDIIVSKYFINKFKEKRNNKQHYE